MIDTISSYGEAVTMESINGGNLNLITGIDFTKYEAFFKELYSVWLNNTDMEKALEKFPFSNYIFDVKTIPAIRDSIIDIIFPKLVETFNEIFEVILAQNSMGKVEKTIKNDMARYMSVLQNVGADSSES